MNSYKVTFTRNIDGRTRTCEIHDCDRITAEREARFMVKLMQPGWTVTQVS